MAKKNTMCRLSDEQLDIKKKFINNYIKAGNASDGSTFDPNANVANKNVATMLAELNKDINIQVERGLIYDKLTDVFGKSVADEYIRQLEDHEIYCHDETAPIPYCVAISMYPFLTEGLEAFGGETKAPKHLSSYNGGFVNLIFAVSSQFCGAVATVEYLMCFDHFAIKDYGEDYLDTHTKIIQQELQQVIYALNQPASARGNQSPFWNISIFDKNYFDALFGNFTFPDDGSSPKWESVDKLQRFFMRWFNKERTKALLTFPVVTVSLLNDGKDIVDANYKEFTSQELSEGNAFFIYTSNTVDSLSSCCRLRNAIGDQLRNDFSYSLGAGGVMTGSMNVITLNMNRFIQDHWKNNEDEFFNDLKNQITKIHGYQIAFKLLFKDFLNANMMPAYSAHYIDLDKQYLTIGINGLVEGCEWLGYQITPKDKKYVEFAGKVFKTIADCNKKAVEDYPDLKLKFNTEQVPAESLGVKFANWDRIDGYKVTRDCYNSYMYIVEDESSTILDKLELHGKDITGYLDGGSACHINLEDIPTKETFSKILEAAVKTGCPYFCFNTKVTICNDCGNIDKRTYKFCPVCNSMNVDYATRIIGYLRRITNFSSERRKEESERHYHKC